MSAITLKNIPKKLHVLLKLRAQNNKRSLNNEIIACLEQTAGFERIQPDKILATLDRLHKKLHFKVTEEAVEVFKAQGRQ